jgi:hypothetical protein
MSIMRHDYDVYSRRVRGVASRRGGNEFDGMKRRSLLFVLMYDVAVTFRLYSATIERLFTVSLWGSPSHPTTSRLFE